MTEKGLGRKCREGRKRGSEGHLGKDRKGARKDILERTEKGLGRICREGWRRGLEESGFRKVFRKF